MIREEIVKRGYKKYPRDIIEIVNDDGSITKEDCNCNLRNAYMQGLIDNNISLSTDVDEAAEKYVDKWYSIHGLDKESYPIDVEISKADFNAGAEWMAKQGITVKGIARPDDKEIWILQELEDIEDGDKVIVQIRKR